MKSYELLLMIKPNIDSEEVQAMVGKITEAVESLKGKVVDTDMAGRKKLAYDINNFRDAYMVVLKVDLEGSKVAEFNRQLRLNENILRMMFMEVSKVKA
ncbi:MAG: 30S ribosomal protein S6 [Candidatus Gastranaerophilales bacterium]|nr:30S ribosomal protein S6 [Candidatus Gastranaerophilales bacterium]